MKTLGISLALGDIYSDSGDGELAYPVDGAVARFRAVAAEIPCDKASLIVCSAGYSKIEPRIPQPERRVSLAKQLERYVHEHERPWFYFLLAPPVCWSTRNEIRVGIKLAQRVRFVSKDEPAMLVVASNLSHLVRIRLYTALYAPKKWKVKHVRAHHAFSLRSHILEAPKIMKDILYIMRVKNRLRRLRS